MILSELINPFINKYLMKAGETQLQTLSDKQRDETFGEEHCFSLVSLSHKSENLRKCCRIFLPKATQ